jgi:ABC-type sugar transport system ATPase subunit
VTHDQVEAMTMATKIAVMKEGVLQQVDTPDRVYHFPANLFVADFIGSPKVNLLEGKIAGQNVIDLGGFQVAVETCNLMGSGVLAVRPEDILISTRPDPQGMEFVAYSVLPAGADSTIIAKRDHIEVTVREMGISKLRIGKKIWLKFDPSALNLYDKASGNLVTRPA